MTYGSDATLESPFGASRDSPCDSMSLTALPASGLSQIRENEPLLADAKPLANGVMSTTVSGMITGLPSLTNTMSSFPHEIASQAVRDGLLGQELVQLRKQVRAKTFSKNEMKE